MKARHLLSIGDLTPGELWHLINRGHELRWNLDAKPLAGKSIAMLFEKPSLRTRVSFDVGIRQLGGHSIYLGKDEVGLGGREPVADVARVLSRYVDAVVARTFSHQTLQELAEYGSVPIINALSDVEHPCQALADLQTILEHKGHFDGLTVAFIGDGNNVATSLSLATVYAGANFVIASPKGYELPTPIFHIVQQAALDRGTTAQQVNNPKDAIEGADVVYTDVWVSMGSEAETEQRLKDFHGYQVNPRLMELANPDAIFMHDLPAHRGEEISEGMLEHPQSVVFDQAANRLHAQKAALEFLLTQ